MDITSVENRSLVRQVIKMAAEFGLKESDSLDLEIRKGEDEILRRLEEKRPKSREEMIEMLGNYHKQQGVVFLSEQDATDYFKGLIELFEG